MKFSYNHKFHNYTFHISFKTDDPHDPTLKALKFITSLPVSRRDVDSATGESGTSNRVLDEMTDDELEALRSYIAQELQGENP